MKKLRSDMVGVADEFGRQLFNELDYVKEAYNCKRFKVLLQISIHVLWQSVLASLLRDVL